MGGAAGVVALWHQDHVAVLDRHRDVERAVVGVYALQREALLRVEPSGRLSVSCLCEGYDDQQPDGVITSTTSSEWAGSLSGRMS